MWDFKAEITWWLPAKILSRYLYSRYLVYMIDQLIKPLVILYFSQKQTKSFYSSCFIILNLNKTNYVYTFTIILFKDCKCYSRIYSIVKFLGNILHICEIDHLINNIPFLLFHHFFSFSFSTSANKNLLSCLISSRNDACWNVVLYRIIQCYEKTKGKEGAGGAWL